MAWPRRGQVQQKGRAVALCNRPTPSLRPSTIPSIVSCSLSSSFCPGEMHTPEDQFFLSLYCGDFSRGIQAFAHKNACTQDDGSDAGVCYLSSRHEDAMVGRSICSLFPTCSSAGRPSLRAYPSDASPVPSAYRFLLPSGGRISLSALFVLLPWARRASSRGP